MKTFHVVATAALLMTSTAAYAGNSISFDIEGQKIHIEAPNGCNNLSCLQITAPGLANKSFNLNSLNLNGLKSRSDDDDSDVATTTPARPAPQSIPAPQAVAPRPQPPSPPHLLRPPHLRPRPWQRRRPRRSACGRPRRTRAMCGSSSAGRICAAMPRAVARRSLST